MSVCLPDFFESAAARDLGLMTLFVYHRLDMDAIMNARSVAVHSRPVYLSASKYCRRYINDGSSYHLWDAEYYQDSSQDFYRVQLKTIGNLKTQNRPCVKVR